MKRWGRVPRKVNVLYAVLGGGVGVHSGRVSVYGRVPGGGGAERDAWLVCAVGLRACWVSGWCALGRLDAVLRAGCMCACVCRLCQDVCSRDRECPPGLEARRGEHYPRGAHTGAHTHAHTPSSGLQCRWWGTAAPAHRPAAAEGAGRRISLILRSPDRGGLGGPWPGGEKPST